LAEGSEFRDQSAEKGITSVGGGLKIGDQIRIIREPHFGRICRVAALPADLRLLPTGSKVRDLEAELDDGGRIMVPRANVELLEA
jgi:hypothetical protein